MRDGLVKLLTGSLLLWANALAAQDLVATVEAETGARVGVSVSAQAGSSSGSFISGFDAAGDKLTITVTVAESKNYKVVIRYRAASGTKTQDLYANDVFTGNVIFPLNSAFSDLDAGTVYLKSGANTVSILNSWGYVDLDKFTFYTIPPNSYNITSSLIDPLATTATKDLYEFLTSSFRKNIITGQTDSKYDEVKAAAGKSPMLRAYDFLTYCPQYPYSWDNAANGGQGGHAFGPVPDQSPEHAIAWYNATGKKGIVSFHWHWYSPSQGTVGTNTFSTENTTFDVTKAVIPGTQENTDALRDIDAIAVQLKKLSDANVPIIWRPLHEAGGAWFWWGAKGSASCKALWDIVYERLTNHHNLHNMIWLWSSPEPDWYPGNTKTDMIGYDSYPGSYNYSTQKNTFDKLYTITEGKKLIAMSENGPIPDIDSSIDADAPWSYFMSWSDLVFSQNTTQHIVAAFASPRAATLENPDGDPLVVTDVNKELQIACYPNPFTERIYLKAPGNFDYTVYSLSGVMMESGSGSEGIVAGNNLYPGSYFVRVRYQDGVGFFKIIKTL